MGFLRQRPSNIGGTVFSLFFAVFWSGITLTFDVFTAKSAYQQFQAISYPTATGTITKSEVESNHDSDGTTYRPDIGYTYSVGGKQFEGNRYRYGQMGSGDSSAHRIVGSYSVGMQVEVHHAPNDPTDAVLLTGLEGSDLFMMVFMLPFNLVMLGLWTGIINGLRYRLVRPVAGGAKLIDEGRCLRVRLSPTKPLYIAAGASGALAFILTFVVGFGCGFNPSVQVMFAVWGLILGGGGLAYFSACRRLGRGDSDLVIDDFRESVVLPRTFGRQEEVVVPWGKIVSIEVEQVQKPCSEGNTIRNYVPTVTFTDSDGSKRREKLIEWHDELLAKGLVEWLCERLRVNSNSTRGS